MTAKTTTKLLPGEKFDVPGHHAQQVFTLKGFYAKDGGIPKGKRDWVGCIAMATMITLAPRNEAPRKTVEIGSLVQIKGYGLWEIRAPGWCGGDDCTLVPANKTAEKFVRPPRNY